MAGPLITPDDLADFWRPLTDAETTVAESLIDVASAIIRRRLPTIDTDVANGTVAKSLLAYVVTEMVKSAVDATNRPAGAKSLTDTVGPYSRTLSFEAAERLAFTEDLLALLGGSTVSQDVGSLQLGLPRHVRVAPWHCWP